MINHDDDHDSKKNKIKENTNPADKDIFRQICVRINDFQASI